jgi:hypothetical protein
MTWENGVDVSASCDCGVRSLRRTRLKIDHVVHGDPATDDGSVPGRTERVSYGYGPKLEGHRCEDYGNAGGVVLLDRTVGRASGADPDCTEPHPHAAERPATPSVVIRFLSVEQGAAALFQAFGAGAVGSVSYGW